MTLANWAGNLTYRAERLHRPASVDELREIVARAPKIRVLGSRHCFNRIADSDELVSLDDLPAAIEIQDGTVSCGGAVRYGELAEALHAHDLALHNLASLPHISVAGAVATATHGSGARNGNLATAVAALELVTSEGELVHAARGDPDFDGMAVNLGALGAVTRVTLDVEPAYEVRQHVFEGLSWDALLGEDVFAAGYSVSVFTRWAREEAGQLWVKQRADGPEPDGFGARPATVDRHPILGLDPVNCTPQRGLPGRWSDRLPHFRMGFTPSAGDELQTEYHVDRTHARAAIEAVRALGDDIRPALQVGELRTVAADRLWLSPQYGRDTLAIHFTWQPDPPAVAELLPTIEAALEPFAMRPHWGKVFDMDGVGERYERLADWEALRERLDPRDAFRNDWLDRRVL